MLDAAWPAVASLGSVARSSSMGERGGRDGFALQDENRYSEDSAPGAPEARGRAAEGSEQEERSVLVQRLGSPLVMSAPTCGAARLTGRSHVFVSFSALSARRVILP
jgi:hypothetical protein